MTTNETVGSASEVETIPRDTSTLYDLYNKQGSYAGFSDAEIDSLVDYKAELKHRDVAYKEECERQQVLINAQVEEWQKQSAAAIEQLHKLAEAAANPTFVTYDGSINNE